MRFPRTFTENVPLYVLDGSEGELVVTFSYRPGEPPSGWSPEDFDPGSGPELEVIAAHYVGAAAIPVGLGAEEDQRVVDYLLENWEPPEDGPDPDDLRDQERDRRLMEGE